MTSFANLAVLALLGCTSALPNNVQTVHTQSAENTWDYVIVGGGVTGLVVANRLTEETKKSVLVIEAGAADDNPSIRVPYVAALPINGSLLWDLKSVPEPHIANRTFVPKVARALGGGSIVNGMMYDRAAAADYDAWEALGNKGWGWKGLYPYFKKSTELIEPPAEVAEKFGITWDAEAYGKGPLKIGITEFQYPDLKHFFQAFQRAGAYAARSGDNGEAYGTAWFPNTMNPLTSERSHARNSYYEPASKRSNLKVMLETLATEIIFDGKMLTAKGVKITNTRTNSSSAVYARKEVILAAGAIKTPQLLQLSGIGPRSVLEAAGIPVKLEHDGVGANFQDHPYTSMAFTTSNMSEPNPTSWNDPEFNSSAWEQYAENKTGPLTMARGNSLAFIPLQDVDPGRYSSLANQVRSPSNNDFLPSIYKNSKKLLKGFQAQRNVLATLYESDKAGVVEFPIVASGAFELVGLEKPVSRGTIMLNPTDPQGSPKVFYNSFSNPIDKAVLASCVRYLRKVWARPELSRFSLVETSPGAQYTTDDEIMEKAVASGSVLPSLAHPSCSCAMMPEEMGGCVSSELLFYGVKRLSIIDASIIPLVPSQHLQATMYAIGEKAADIIKKRG